MKRLLSFAVIMAVAFQVGLMAQDWISLFDGETFNGWQPSENPDSWQIEDGALVTRGPRSHLFYVGDVQNHNFQNFEFMAEVKTEPVSNSGIYIHTEFQEGGWPSKGYECQVINSYPEVQPGRTPEQKMTGSLYAIRNVYKTPVKDNEWFNYRIVVQGKTIRIYINDVLMSDYTEPDSVYRTRSMPGRILSSGTFALQCHDPNSVVYYKNLRVKPLPDTLPTLGTPPEDLEFETQLINIAGSNFPLMDLHVHIKGGLTMEAALENARYYGYTYGCAVNCGLQMGIETEDSLRKFIDAYEKPPNTFFAMQAEGREWMDLFSEESVARFDYVFTDAMTITNDDGKRMRLWMRNEVEVGDPQDFMDMLVDRIEKIMNNEPVDIYVNPSFLPTEISDRYDELWTTERMDRVIQALVENDVAMEINARYRLPSPTFIKRAKEGGVKFTFGTNNGSNRDLGRMEYCIEMIEECDLRPTDMWIPQRNQQPITSGLNIDGRWQGEMGNPDMGNMVLVFNFKVDGETLTGTVESDMGNMPISNGKVNGADFSFDVDAGGMVISHQCVYSDETISMTVPGFGDGGSMILKRMQ